MSFGCGRDMCLAQREYVTDAQPREPVDPALVAEFGSAAIDWSAANDKRVAYHEAGHAVVDAIVGRPAAFATLGLTPHIRCAPGGKATFEGSLMARELDRSHEFRYRSHVQSCRHP